MVRSRPSLARQIAAGAIMAAGGGYVAAVKLTREGDSVLASAWLAGVLPNLVCGAIVPLVAFLSRRALRVGDFLWMTLFTLVGLCLYEFAQLWMPRRTFDWDDVWATMAGALLALVVGAGFYLATSEKSAEPGAAAGGGGTTSFPGS
jgi:VanZ like family